MHFILVCCYFILHSKYFTVPETGEDSGNNYGNSQIPEDALEWNGHCYAIYDDTSICISSYLAVRLSDNVNMRGNM